MTKEGRSSGYPKTPEPEMIDLGIFDGRAIKFIKYILHYFFGKHSCVFVAKTYRGNEKIGHVEDEYIFECEKCHKKKIIKVVDRFSL